MLGSAGTCGVALIPCPPFIWLEISGAGTEAENVVVQPTVCGTFGGTTTGIGAVAGIFCWMAMGVRLESPNDCIRFGIYTKKGRLFPFLCVIVKRQVVRVIFSRYENVFPFVLFQVFFERFGFHNFVFVSPYVLLFFPIRSVLLHEIM